MGSLTSLGEAGAGLFETGVGCKEAGKGCLEAVVGRQEADARCLEADVRCLEAVVGHLRLAGPSEAGTGLFKALRLAGASWGTSLEPLAGL